MKTRLKTLSKNIHEFFNRHWIFTTFILKFSSVWFSLILTFWGKVLGLTSINEKQERYLTLLGIVLTLVIVVFTIGIAIIERYHDLHNDEKMLYLKTSAEKDLLNTINSSVNDICKRKMNSQLSTIQRIRDGKVKIPEIYTQPCEQIKIILDELVNCLNFLVSEKGHQFKKEDFQISLLYNLAYEEPNTWHFAHNYTPTILKKEEILKPESTFSYLLQTGKPFVFFNSKQKAFEEHHYIKSPLDETDTRGNLKGSIGCYLINIGNSDGIYIRAVLSISTYKKQLINESDFKGRKQDVFEEELKNACHFLFSNIKENLINNYQYRIGVELCNYYIQFLDNKKNKKNIRISLTKCPEAVT